jgi:hypothetical protein
MVTLPVEDKVMVLFWLCKFLASINFNDPQPIKAKIKQTANAMPRA